MNKQGKVVLVGTGFVGMSMAYSMLNRGGVSELVLIDIDKEKTIGEQMDLSHGLPFAPQKIVIKAEIIQIVRMLKLLLLLQV